MNEHFFIYNGRPIAKNALEIGPTHPGLMHGDGLFETMRMHKGKILNERLHQDRLRHGCDVLGYEATEDKISTIFSNCQSAYARFTSPHLRVRLSIYRSESVFTGEGTCTIDYLIQVIPATVPVFKQEGISAIIYPDSKKDSGTLSNLKHSSYLLHTQAFRAARTAGKDEAIILNDGYRVCETSIANIFFIEGDTIITPRLNEGCVAGTLRRWLVENQAKIGYKIVETTCSVARLLSADEVFITNAIRWIVPLRAIDDTKYRIRDSHLLFDRVKACLM